MQKSLQYDNREDRSKSTGDFLPGHGSLSCEDPVGDEGVLLPQQMWYQPGPGLLCDSNREWYCIGTDMQVDIGFNGELLHEIFISSSLAVLCRLRSVCLCTLLKYQCKYFFRHQKDWKF